MKTLYKDYWDYLFPMNEFVGYPFMNGALSSRYLRTLDLVETMWICDKCDYRVRIAYPRLESMFEFVKELNREKLERVIKNHWREEH